MSMTGFPGTEKLWEQLQLQGWSRPQVPDEIAALDRSLRDALFAQVTDGLAYLVPPPSLAGAIPSALADDPVIPLKDSIGLFVNPQGCGVLTFLAGFGIDERPASAREIREWLYMMAKGLRWSDWGQTLLAPVEALCGHVDIERAFPVVACRFRTHCSFVETSAGDLDRYDDELIACSLCLKSSENRVSRPARIKLATLNPYHRAAVCDSGAAHFFVDSVREDSNAARTSWGVTTFAWIILHELLYRVSAFSLTREARRLADLDSNSLAAPQIEDLTNKLLKFLIYADIIRSGHWEPMGEFHEMARQVIGGRDAASSLRDILTLLQQTASSNRRELTALRQADAMRDQLATTAQLLHLQRGLEWIEAIFVAYYAVAIVEHLGTAFHFSEPLIQGGLIGSVVLGLTYAALWKTRPHWLVVVFAGSLLVWFVTGLFGK